MLWQTPELDSSSDDVIMHHDKKVGLGLGILLVGIVGAFFFREEPRTRDPLPELQSAEILDREISESLVDDPSPKNDLAQYERRYQPFIDLQGIETADTDVTDPGVSPAAGKVFDEEFDFLNEPADPNSRTTPASPGTGESSLADNRGGRNPVSNEESKPVQDVTVSQNSSPRQRPSPRAMFSEDLSFPEEASAQAFPHDDREAVEGNSGDSGDPQAADHTRLRTYVVQSGDTLSGIASRFLGRQTGYRTIFEFNRDQLSSPDDLRPGMRLKIPAPEQTGEATGISQAEPREAVEPDSSFRNRKSDQSPTSKRDRRVIVPRRVRLNEPIANKPNRDPANRPRARFKLDPPAPESTDGLPTLEGLEPLEVPR